MNKPLTSNTGPSLSNEGSASVSNNTSIYDNFINPNRVYDVDEQLAIMTNFWEQIGLKVPVLHPRQLDNAGTVTSNNPNLRLLPTPLLNVWGRSFIAERMRGDVGNHVDEQLSILRLPDMGTIYRKLVFNMDQKVAIRNNDSNNLTKYSLRYKTPQGTIVMRSDYIDALCKAEQAIVDEDNIVWTYPVMDVQVNSPRKEMTAEQLYNEVHWSASPEALIVVRGLHLLANIPKGLEIDFSNEAVFEETPSGTAQNPAYINTIRWRDDWHRIGWYARRHESIRDYLGVRTTKSALEQINN